MNPGRYSLRIVVPLALLVAALLLIVFGFILRLRLSFEGVETRAVERAQVLGSLMVSSIETAYRLGSIRQIRAAVEEANSDRTVVAAALIDDTGRVLFARPLDLEGATTDETPFRSYISQLEAAMRTRTPQYVISNGSDRLVAAFPLRIGSRVESPAMRPRYGVLALSFDLSGARARALNESLRLLPPIIAVVLSGFLLIALLLHRYLTRQIQSLVQGTRSIAQGNFDTRLALGGSREFSLIAESMNQMAEQLAEDRRLLMDNEAALARERRAASLGHIATRIADEFNNLLMSILPFTEVIQRRGEDPVQREKALGFIVGAVHRGKATVAKIVQFARPAAPKPEELDLALLLEELTGELTEELADRWSIDIRTEADLRVMADRDQIRQVILNLVTNAAGAMPSGGTIFIRTASGPEQGGAPTAFLSVADGGAGIPEEVLPHIFEPLFTTRGDRMGLGLAVAHQIIESHGGTIRVRSGEGAGTTIEILLPALEQERAHSDD